MLTNIDQNFGRRIRLYRTVMGFSQQDLASYMTLIGFPISAPTIGNIERSRRRVTVGEASGFACVLTVDLERLIAEAKDD